jgi:fructose-bisphosphate aldolase, class I
LGLGKTIRLNRLFAHPTGRFCSVAVDHFIGDQLGIPSGLRNAPATIQALVAGLPDAVTMHKGMAVSCWPPYAGRIPLIMQSVIGRPDDSADEVLATPEDAVRLGADAFATCAFVRGNTEAIHLRRVADSVRDADRADMPVILHIYPRRITANSIEVSFAPDDIAWAVRCGIECGVDVIKVPFTSDVASYAQIVKECPVPVVAAGGPKAETLREALAMASDVVAAGARGLTIGRNVWGFPQITQAVRAFKAVIHERLEYDAALRSADLSVSS